MTIFVMMTIFCDDDANHKAQEQGALSSPCQHQNPVTITHDGNNNVNDERDHDEYDDDDRDHQHHG